MLKNLRLFNYGRCIHLLQIRNMSYTKAEYKSNNKLETSLENAAKIVDYTPSLSNQLGKNNSFDFGKYLEKMNESSHPILKVRKSLLSDERNSINIWGLIILLLSKSAGHKIISNQLQYNGILQKQRELSQLTELLKMGHLVHTAVLSPTKDNLNQNDSTLNTGNKIALLTGDFFLTTTFSMLSNIRNSHVNGLMSSALRDLTDSEFIGERNFQNHPMPSLSIEGNFDSNVNVNKILLNPDRNTDPLDQEGCMGDPVREWTLRNILGGGSLLGKGCESALHLAGYDQETQRNGYRFGCHTALAWQANADINAIISSDSEEFSLVNAPVLFALHQNPSMYEMIRPGFKDLKSVQFDEIRKIIKTGTALDDTTKLLNEHKGAAIECLDHIPHSNINCENKLISVIDAL